MNDFIFTFDSMTCKGKSFPAGYSVTPSGSVLVFVQQDNGEKTRIRFNPDHPYYSAALAAAKAVKTAGERSETISEPAPITAPAPEKPAEQPAAPAKAEQPADGKQTRGPVPEKTFIGQIIEGKGWRILFDGETGRTRVIFDAAPSDAARAAVEKAGFYFSAVMNSWNKKLTFKAYRAAQALSVELQTVCA